MNHNDISERGERRWIAAAGLVPLLQAASRGSWLTVLVTCGGILLLCRWLLKFPVEPPKWLLTLQSVWICLIVSELLHWSGYCWTEHRNAYGAPLILLTLSVWLSAGGTKQAQRIGNVLLWPVLVMLGAVLLAAVPSVRFENLLPSWKMPDAYFISMLLVFLLHRKQEGSNRTKQELGIGAIAVAVAAAAGGVLSGEVSGSIEAPIYELGRSVGLFGGVERFESLVAVAMTIGYFVSISYLLLRSKDALPGKGANWAGAGASAALYLSGIRVDSRVMAIGCVVLWVAVPAALDFKKIFQKT